MILMCPGLFAGELIVLLDSDHKTIKCIMKSTNPDLFICKSTFNELVTQYFAQCIFFQLGRFHSFRSAPLYILEASFMNTDSECKEQTLCSKCIRLAFMKEKVALNAIGFFEQSVCFFACVNS